MPNPSPREFFKRLGKPERWCFTAHELKHPRQCRRTDEFLASVPPDEYGGRAVIVLRDGTVTNRWDDGTVGVPPAAQQHADMEEEIYRLGTHGYLVPTEAWRDVMADAKGRFLSFTDNARWQGEALAEQLIEGSAAQFIKSTVPALPQFVQDLQQWGWELRQIERNRTYFELRFSGFFIFGSPTPGFVKLLASLHGGEQRGELMSLCLYDHAVWEPPIGNFQVYWRTVKPYVQIWQKTLVVKPPEDDASYLPTFTQWRENWNQLRRDLKLRQWEEP